MTATPKSHIETASPFLRWAGGKSWLIKEFTAILPAGGFKNYHEPFLGGAAAFFFLRPQVAFLSDLNNELIETYSSIKEECELVIGELKKFQNTESFYYKLRDKKFQRSSQRAARFIFLNQTSFNGIYRVNLKGEYNVPYGFRSKNFLNPDNLRKASAALQNAKIFNADFSCITNKVKSGDLVFLDPPYTVTHNNNGFIKYNQKLFSIDDQKRLAQVISQVKEIGAYYILTNAAHDAVRKIFQNKSDTVLELKRASLIGGLNAKRGRYSEYVFTNCIKK